MKHILLFLFTALLVVSCVNKSTNDDNRESDSVLTREYIKKIHLSNPDRALRLLDSAENLHKISEYDLNALRSNVYNGAFKNTERAIEYWLRNSESDTLKYDPKKRIDYLAILCGMYIETDKFSEVIKTAHEGLVLAHQHKETGFEGRFYFYLGESFMRTAQYKEGWENMNKAISLYEKLSDKRLKPYTSYFYGEMMSYLDYDKKYEEAIKVGMKRMKLIKEMSTYDFVPQGYIDQQYGYLYAKMATYYVRVKNMKKAQEMIDLFYTTTFSKQPTGEYYAMDYFLASKQYQKVIAFFDELGSWKGFDSDSISFASLSNLNMLIQAHTGLKDYKGAYDYQEKWKVINDSLTMRERTTETSKMAALYKTHAAEMELQDQKATSKFILIIAISCGLLLTAAIILIVVMLYNSKIIRQKNKGLMRKIEALHQCQLDLDEAREQILQLTSKEMGDIMLEDGSYVIHPQHPASENPINVVEHAERREDYSEEQIKARKEKNINYALFRKLEKMMNEEKLFLQPDLSRQSVLDLLKIDKNRLSAVIKENSNCGNLTNYHYCPVKVDK